MRSWPWPRPARLRRPTPRPRRPTPAKAAADIATAPDGRPTTALPAATRTPVLAADIVAARKVTAAVNATRRAGEPSAQAGELAALELLHEIFHLLIEKAAELGPATRRCPHDRRGRGARRRARPSTTCSAPWATSSRTSATARPRSASRSCCSSPLANENPAARPLRVLVDDTPLPPERAPETIEALEAYQAALPPIGPNGETLVELLRAPARAHPTSLAGQLRYVREHWRSLLGDALERLLDRLLLTLDVIAEEERGLHLRFGGGGDGGPAAAATARRRT